MQSDPVGLLGGLSTYGYVNADPVRFFDPNGLGKEGGQTNIGGNDPLMPRDINKNTPRQRVEEQIKKIDEEIKRNPSMNKDRVRKLRAWQKVAGRGFSKAICPPLLEVIVMEVAREQCLRGDINMCQVFLDLGGEIELPGA